MRRVILSTKLIIGQGTFQAKQITKEEALAWLTKGEVENYCGHVTVRILGLEPDQSRKQCPGYDEALALNAKERLEFGREYSLEEIEAIGVEFTLIHYKRDQIQELIALAGKLPTGLEDPHALTKLDREMEELYQATEAGDPLGIVMEGGDVVYYAIKSQANGLLSITRRDELIDQIASAVGLQVRTLLDCAIAKMSLRATGDPKNDANERAVVARVLDN